MNRLAHLVWRIGQIGLLAGLTACVTVNVNFPEAAVQQATDDYVQELYKSKEKDRAQPSSSAPIPAPSKKPSVSWVFPDLIPQAFAAELAPSGEMKIRVDSPKARSIRDRQITRLDKIRAAEAAGQVGESNTGLLTVQESNPALKSQLQPWVDAENQDRQDLYQEILSSNGYPSTRLIDLEKSFARSFQSHAAPGAWIQDDAGKWLKKR